MAFLRDLRYSIRSLSRSPGLTVLLFATIAVGIGTHTTVAGFINGLLSRSLAVPDQHRIATIHWREAGEGYLPVPSAAFLRLRAAASFASLAAVRESRTSVAMNGRRSWMSIATASPELWDVLKLPAALGRMTFQDDGHGPESIGAIVSHKMWRNELGGKPDIVGAEIAVDGRRGHIAGVAPEWFEGLFLGRAIDVWVPFDAAALVEKRIRTVQVIGRLQSESSVEDAQLQLSETIGTEPGAVVMPYSGIEPEVQDKLARLRSLLSWAGALVFLTAAANVAGFLLSRASRRSHETAARVALGATRARLAGQIAADSLVVSAGGGALGGLVAFWTATAFPALLYAEDAERLSLIPDVNQIAAAVGLYTAIMLLCALAPLAQIHQHGPMTTLRRSGDAATTSVGWLRSLLVVAQMSVCVILVIGTALLFQGFREALRTVRADHLGQPVVAVLEASAGYGRPDEGRDYFQRAEREAGRVLGIYGTVWTGTLPGARTSASTVRLEPPAAGFSEVTIDTVTPSGQDLVDLSLTGGRPFGGGDGPFSCRVALVNDEMAAQHFYGDAVGRSIQDASGRRIDIVGTVKDVKLRSNEPADPRVYFYERQALAAPAREGKAERFRIRIQPVSRSTATADLDTNVVSNGYFDAIGASFDAGEGFADGADPGGCETAVINREAAQLYFEGNAIGGAVIDTDGRRAEIAAVVDAGALRVMQRRAAPMVYFSSEHRYVPRMALIAQAQVASPELIAGLAERLKSVPGGAGVPEVMTLEERLARISLGPERIATVLVGASATIALGLGVLGAYGVIADSVRQRKREIALRLALGAQGWKIVGGVFRDGVRIAAAGAVAGLLASAVLVEAVVRANPGFARPALWMWLACPMVLLAVVAVASIFPARWALAVDPLTLTREG